MLANRRGRKSICLDDVRSRLEVLGVNFLDDRGAGEQEDFIVTLQILAIPTGESLAAVGGLVQLVALNHCAHRAVNEGDTLLQKTV